MKKYIVTGATGYLGYVLVHHLVEQGYAPIKILIRSKKAFERFSHLPVTASYGDITDIDFLNKEITEKSVVFHLAGMIDISFSKRKQLYKVNVDGTKNIVEACIMNNVEKLIYCSSVAAIIPTKKGTSIKEPNTFNPKKVSGHYAKTKAITSEYILNKSKNGPLNACVVYPSAIIGPHDHHISNLGEVVLGYMNNKFPAYTSGMYNFVDVRDVADGLIKAYEKGKKGEDYILTGETIDLKEMFVILNEILKREKLPFKVPLWFLKGVSPLISLYYTLRRKKPIFTWTSLKILNQNSVFDNSKAVNELGFEPMTTKESFSDMILWFNENKKELLVNK